jgi:hypothetical protein
LNKRDDFADVLQFLFPFFFYSVPPYFLFFLFFFFLLAATDTTNVRLYLQRILQRRGRVLAINSPTDWQVAPSDYYPLHDAVTATFGMGSALNFSDVMHFGCACDPTKQCHHFGCPYPHLSCLPEDDTGMQLVCR